MTLATPGCINIETEELYSEAVLNAPYDAIIVPGYPLKKGIIGKVLKSRILWSYYLYNKGLTKNIIFSGGSVYTPYYESKAMSMYARALGIPQEHIYIETRARHSSENIYYSHGMAVDLGFENIALATDPYQLKFTMGLRERFDIEYDYLPIVYEKIESLDIDEPNLDFADAFNEDFEPITEESWFNRIKGTLGLNIVDE